MDYQDTATLLDEVINTSIKSLEKEFKGNLSPAQFKEYTYYHNLFKELKTAYDLYNKKIELRNKMIKMKDGLTQHKRT